MSNATEPEKPYRIHRHNYENRFTVMPHHIVEHPHLSWSTKAILWYMLSRPVNWKVYRSQLANLYAGDRRGNGKYAIDSAFEELIEHGFIVYTQKDPKTGKFIHRYDVYPDPQCVNSEIKEKNPKAVKPEMGLTQDGLTTPQTRKDYSTYKNQPTIDKSSSGGKPQDAEQVGSVSSFQEHGCPIASVADDDERAIPSWLTERVPNDDARIEQLARMSHYNLEDIREQFCTEFDGGKIVDPTGWLVRAVRNGWKGNTPPGMRNARTGQIKGAQRNPDGAVQLNAWVDVLEMLRRQLQSNVGRFPHLQKILRRWHEMTDKGLVQLPYHFEVDTTPVAYDLTNPEEAKKMVAHLKRERPKLQ